MRQRGRTVETSEWRLELQSRNTCSLSHFWHADWQVASPKQDKEQTKQDQEIRPPYGVVFIGKNKGKLSRCFFSPFSWHLASSWVNVPREQGGENTGTGTRMQIGIWRAQGSSWPTSSCMPCGGRPGQRTNNGKRIVWKSKTHSFTLR